MLRETDTQMSAEEFLESSSVSPKTNADLLEFTVTDAGPALAERLVSVYAREFVEYRRERDTRALSSARIDLEQTLAEFDAEGDRGTDLYRSLLESQQQLRTLEALQLVEGLHRGTRLARYRLPGLSRAESGADLAHFRITREDAAFWPALGPVRRPSPHERCCGSG